MGKLKLYHALVNMSKDSMVLPPINNGRHKKTKTNFVFPKIGGMSGSSYSNSSHFMSMYQNRQSLDTTFRDKLWTGNEDNVKHFGVNNSFKSLEVGDSETGKLNYYSNFKRNETIMENSYSKVKLVTMVPKNSI